MKIRNLKINKELISVILHATLTLGIIGGTVMYYQVDNKEQVCEMEINNNNIFVDENGQFSCYFGTGEHIIVVSRNDAYYRKSEEIEGYIIKEVEINGWRDNNKITYVNTEPVVVVATGENNDQLEFNDFGTVVTEKNIQK